jgi:beta-lactamase regulating signal transducer with metallopeptidase domain
MSTHLPGLLLEAALRGSAVLLLVVLAIPIMRRRSAAVRHAAWTFAIGAQLLLPALVLVAPAWRLPLVQAPEWAGVALAPSPAGSTGGSGEALSVERQSTTPMTVVPTRRVPGAGLGRIGMVWAIGTGLILLHLAIGTIGVWRLAARSRRVLEPEWLSLSNRLALEVGISRPLTLLRGGSLAVPVTWGIVYPVLLLPEEAEGWDEEQRRYVLVHEMAHIRRFDALTDLLGQLTVALFWFNPLVWLAASRMRAERERACDDYVLRAGTTPSRYATDLLEMVRSIGSRSTATGFAALAMARPSEFEGRMVAILDDRIDRKPLSGLGLAAGTGVAALLGLTLAGFSPLAPPPAEVALSLPATSALHAPADTVKPRRSPQGRPSDPRPSDPRPADRAALPVAQEPSAGLLAVDARSGDPARLRYAIRAVASLAGDGEKAVVLAHAAPGALAGNDGRLREEFFAAVRSISRSEDRALALVHAAANANGSPAVAAEVLRATAGMRSPEAVAMVLMNVAQRGLITSDALGEMYLRVASSLPAGDAREGAMIAFHSATATRPTSQR